MAAATQQQPPASPAVGLARWVPSLPTVNLNSFNPFANTEQSPKQSPQVDDNARQSTGKRPLLSPSLHPGDPPSPSRSNADSSVMFAEPDTRSNSDEGESREGSIDERKRSKKSNKPKTRFSVCHAPPTSTTRQKLHRRPRALLQLHKLSASAGVRPEPAFEVVPSANFSVRLTRAITKVFKAKHGLCPNDLVVLRAQKYSAADAGEDEEHDAHDVIGLICKGRKDKEEGMAAAGKAKICMMGGQEWEAYPLMNGGYEFFSTDEHGLGLTVRWVPKRNKDGSKPTDNKRFNFSTISPNSRRHPVIANLSKTGLEINDVYKMPDTTSTVTPRSTPKQDASILADAMEEAGENAQCLTDDRLREVITMTAIWVTFKESWSPNFKYDDNNKESAAAAMKSVQNSPSKSIIGSAFTTPPGSPQMAPLEKRTSIKSIGSGIMRHSSLLSKGNRSSQISVPEEGEDIATDELPRRSESINNKKTTIAGVVGRARGDSTSTVLVHRAASNRRKNNQQAAWRPDLLSAQMQQVHETSREDLRSGGTTSTAGHVLTDIESDGEVLTPDATPVKKEPVAQPLLPESTPATPRARTPVPPVAAANVSSSLGLKGEAAKRESMVKRESNATTDTFSSGVPAKAAAKSKKRKSGWRRLLCGAGMNDV